MYEYVPNGYELIPLETRKELKKQAVAHILWRNAFFKATGEMPSNSVLMRVIQDDNNSRRPVTRTKEPNIDLDADPLRRIKTRRTKKKSSGTGKKNIVQHKERNLGGNRRIQIKGKNSKKLKLKFREKGVSEKRPLSINKRRKKETKIQKSDEF